MKRGYKGRTAWITVALLWPLLGALPGPALPGPSAAQPGPVPLESPKATVSQVVGFEPIVLTYHSPGVKGRKIWGELVPYGQNWRAGANDKTTVQFFEKVRIGETELDAGIFGLYVLLHSDERWELVLNSDAEGSPNTFEPSNDVVRVEVTPQEVEFRERLLYSIENFTDWPPFRAEIALHWEKRRIVLPVVVLNGWKAP